MGLNWSATSLRYWKYLKALLMKFLRIKLQIVIHAPTWVWITSHLDHGQGRVVGYMLKVGKKTHWLPRIMWEASRKIQKTIKSKNLGSSYVQGMKKRFEIVDTLCLFHDANASQLCELTRFLKCQCLTTWERCRDPCFLNVVLHM